MDRKDKISIGFFSVLSVLGLGLVFYGSTQPATNILVSRFSQEYLGEINIFTVAGLVLLPVSFLLLFVWFFTLSKKAENKAKAEPKWWKPYWIGLVLATIALGAMLTLFWHVSAEKATLYTSLVLIAEGVAYYARIKQSLTLNRAMYLLLAFPIGFVLWFSSLLVLTRILNVRMGENAEFTILGLVACYAIGALIGDYIGRLRHYKGPAPYQP